MVSLAPTAMDAFAEAATSAIESATGLANVGVCVDSACTTGRAAVNFFYSSNPVSKTFFGTSIICGVTGTVVSGASLVGKGLGIPGLGFGCDLAARGCCRLGKYTMKMGNVTSGNITGFAEAME